MEMKQVKIQDIQGKALDYLVALCEGKVGNDPALWGLIPGMWGAMKYQPTKLWAQGGPIVERERISIDYDTDVWNAAKSGLPWYLGGCTALVAAMRCYVASKLGDVVEVPASLL